ncbi:chorismate--pyruvate lyase family protein [Methanococcus aeolicus]|uniref:chorismate--pyruvate lyase family protein n=1 Tax=Methanococcus aeolicus TaxID=42879 RepID=UPI0021C5A021|nr:chorismate pyruvate-lyase family protein [Methanococcus aeolicus]UXM84635.1 chorismate pyruvate-lyase family protein [Methanococcus aeolicus]
MKTPPYVKISELQQKYNLKNEEKIFLGTDGSITNLLEILFNDKVIVKTISQMTIEDTYYRTVILKIKNIPMIYATSKIPLKNIKNNELRENISKDLLSADIPIGKILKMHNLETRREIKNITYDDIDKNIQQYLETTKTELPQRTYNIIYKNNILMELTEIFNVGEYL